MNNRLFCTFVKHKELENKIKQIIENYTVMYNRVFVLSIKHKPDLAITYTPLDYSQSDLDENTILLHRKKQFNVLYSINAINIIIMENNNGVLDKSYQINWGNYQNSILLSHGEILNVLPTQIFKIISI